MSLVKRQYILKEQPIEGSIFSTEIKGSESLRASVILVRDCWCQMPCRNHARALPFSRPKGEKLVSLEDSRRLTCRHERAAGQIYIKMLFQTVKNSMLDCLSVIF